MSDVKMESALACNLTAISADVRDTHILNARELFQMTSQVRELSDGFALRLPNEAGMLVRVASFIEHERECCPFFRFALELEPEGGPLWLELAGRDGVKDFIRSEFGDDLQVAEA